MRKVQSMIYIFALVSCLGIIFLSFGRDISQFFINLAAILLAHVVANLATFIFSRKRNNLESIADRIGKISSSIESFNQDINNTNSSMQQSMQSIDTNIRNIAEASQSIHHKAESNDATALSLETDVEGCRTTLNSCESKMTDLVDNMNELESKNLGLGNKLKTEIAQITEVASSLNEIADQTQRIDDIVFQTKLLSFNASVEAARAGEAGKGFAVVADEIASLAQFSSQAAQEINSIVCKKTALIKNTVESFQKGTLSAIESTIAIAQENQCHSHEVNNSITEVTKSFNKIAEDFKSISIASREQKDELTPLTQSTQDLTRKSNHSLELISSLIKKSEGMKSEIESLAKISSDLISHAKNIVIKDISPAEASSVLATHTCIDVRRPDEYYSQETGHIENAMLITLGEKLEQKLKNMDPKAKYLFVCRSGGRSARAARVAQKVGIKNIKNLEGGMLRWVKENLPVVRENQPVNPSNNSNSYKKSS